VFLFHEKKIFCVKIISTKFNHPKKSHEDSLEKTNQNKQRVFRLLFRRKKINGARKEIFLNEKKKQFCMMLNYKTAPKQTHKMMIYIYSFNFYNNKKPNNFTKFLKEIYICFFIIIIIIINYYKFFVFIF